MTCMSQMVAGIVPVSLEFTDANTVVRSQHVSQPYFKMDALCLYIAH